MASFVRNICAKNCQNPLIILKVTIDNVGIPFFETQLYDTVTWGGNWEKVLKSIFSKLL